MSLEFPLTRDEKKAETIMSSVEGRTENWDNLHLNWFPGSLETI